MKTRTQYVAECITDKSHNDMSTCSDAEIIEEIEAMEEYSYESYANVDQETKLDVSECLALIRLKYLKETRAIDIFTRWGMGKWKFFTTTRARTQNEAKAIICKKYNLFSTQVKARFADGY